MAAHAKSQLWEAALQLAVEMAKRKLDHSSGMQVLLIWWFGLVGLDVDLNHDTLLTVFSIVLDCSVCFAWKSVANLDLLFAGYNARA